MLPVYRCGIYSDFLLKSNNLGYNPIVLMPFVHAKNINSLTQISLNTQTSLNMLGCQLATSPSLLSFLLKNKTATTCAHQLELKDL